MLVAGMENNTFNIIRDLYNLLRNSDQGQLVLDGKAKLTLPVSVLEKLNNTFLLINNLTANEEISTKILQNVIYLQEFISKTPKLKLTHLKGPPPSVVDITRFVNLRYIELVHINLSCVKGLQALRPQLQFLTCTSSSDSFEDIFAGDSNSLQIWEELRTLDLSSNKIEVLGLRIFISTPWIQHLDLSSNKISYIGSSLEFLNNLKCLNLSYNQLDSLPSLSQESYKKLEVLMLCHNVIEDISSIWLFNNLSKLDLSYNLIDDHINITSLTELKKLQWLSFIGNPISHHRYHRTYTCVCLSKSASVLSLILDNQKLNSDEIKILGTRSSRAFYASPRSTRREASRRKFRRTVSSASSVNSCNTVINVNLQHPSMGHRSELIITDTELNIASTSSIKKEEKVVASPSLARSLSSSSRKMPKIREAVIVDADKVVQPSPPLPQPDGNEEHLEMKKEVEVLRQRFGEDHWLHSHAGSFVQDLLGLQKTPRSTSLLSEMSSSQVSFEEENQQQQSKLNNSKCDQLSTLALNIEGKSNESCENSENSKHISPVQSENKADHFSVSSYDHTNNNKREQETTVDENTAGNKAYDSGSEQFISAESNANPFFGGNTVDEGYDDEEEDTEKDEDNDDYTHPWLVQKVLTGKLEEVFLVLKEKELLEKDPFKNHTLVRWGLSTLLSCVKVNANPPTVQLTFDTLRRNCEKRTYVMEPSDSQVLLQRLGEVLELRPLSAMNQSMFRCIKCSALFCKELKTTIRNLVGGFSLSCEVCGSNLVVKVDENDDDIEHLPSSGKIASATTNNNSNSGNASASSNYNSGLPKESFSPAVPVAQPKLSASPSQCSIGSAASLDQSSSRESPAAGLGDSNNVIMTSQSVRCDSDIEIISNPSQSSIEVLEVSARLQGTNTPNRKRSSEERQTVAIPQLKTVPEVINTSGAPSTNSTNTGTVLTESSSSGSLTDSICTAYENNPPANNTRRLPSQGSVGEKFIEETSADNSPDNKNTTDNYIMQSLQSSGKDYNSILQDLLKSVSSKLESPDGTDPSLTGKILESDTDNIRYNFNKFCEVDHRIKLFLYEKLFKNDDEHLIVLLRGDVIDKNNICFPGCLVISTYSCFLLKVIGEERGDDAGNFLDKVLAIPLSKFGISRLSWDQGILMNIDNTQYLLILHDLVHTNDFLKFVVNFQYANNSFKCLSDDDNETISSCPYVDSDRYIMLRNVLMANKNIKDSSQICTLSVTCSTTIKRDNENDVVMPMACIGSTSCDLFILTSDLRWLYKEDELPVMYTAHNIINLIDVGVQGCRLSLHYLDESEGIEESWILTFKTDSAINSIIESIRKPWEEIFSVPLQVAQIINNDVI